MLRRIVICVSIFVTGAILGPVIFAATSSLGKSEDPIKKSEAVERMVESYRSHLRPGRLFLSIMPPPMEEECGYALDAVFDSNKFDWQNSAEEFTEELGYYAVDRWRTQAVDEDYVMRIAGEIFGEMSVFEISFLRKCMDSTVFSTMCMERVSNYADQVDRFDSEPSETRSDARYGKDIVCTYVDGAAARKRIPLVSRSD